MGKTELARVIAEKTGITHKKASECIDVFTETVIRELAEGREVSLVGFGTFRCQKRNERTMHLPGGKEHTIPEHRCPAFRAGKNFKESVK